jgi:pyruvate formate lyase activating enzyme
MKIGGFQRFSLLDYPGQLAAIVFTQGCNFRCPYCHNPALVKPELFEPELNTEWVLRFLYRRRKKLGAVVITGGEPTLQEDLIPFLKLLKAMRYKVKLDTNGSLPGLLQSISDQNLVDYYAMDLKAPLYLYKTITRSEIQEDTINDSMEIIRRAGVPYEFRTTFFDLILGSKDLYAMQKILKPGDRYILQECRYGCNLEKLEKPSEANLDLPSLDSSEATRSLIDWGREHSISISVRSL